jgi:PAS domain S-box-containing protein
MNPNLRLPLSLRQRLSLFTCALLLSVILVFGLISYIGVRKAALKVGQDRLQSLTEQFSTSLSGSSRSFISTTFAAGNKPAIKSYLLSNGKDSAAETLKLIEDLRKDTSYVQIELKNADRIQVLKSVKDRIDIKISIDTFLEKLTSAAKPDSGRVGKLYAMDSSVYYPIMATIIDENKPIGYVIRWRKMTTTTKALEQISQLLGTDAKLLVGNDDGSLWTNMRVPVSSPQLTDKTKGVVEYSRANHDILAHVRPITNSHWLIAVELSKNKILEAANRFLYWLMIAGFIILVIGITVAWFMSRKLSEPLRKLTEAASAIASGNHSTQVQVNRHDELGKLARAFNVMEVQVQKSQKALEEKAEKYRLLFENNPMPMWIIARDTLNVIGVNKAAVKHYGYTKEEFLKLSTLDLRPVEDIEKYLSYVREKKYDGNSSGIWRHKKKDGELIMADVIADDIIYQGQQSRLILANDVTAKLKAEAELVSYRIQQQKIITETTIEVQEKEREEIGKELHDNINQILAAAKMHLELGMKRKETMEPFIKSSENIDLAIQEIRQLSQTLVAPSLDNITLPEAIEEIVDNMGIDSVMKIELNVKNYDGEKINDNTKLIFYRIVQEQLNNVLKHSQAKNVIIELSTTLGNTVLTVQDDGIGFDTTKARKGIGLRNIAHRAKFYNGSAEIISLPGKGSRLEVKIPLKQEGETN